MAGEDHLIERLRVARGGHDRDAARSANHAGGGLVDLDAVAEGGGEFFDVVFGAAVDRPPRVLGVEAEETVIVEKPQERRGRETASICSGGVLHTAELIGTR